MNKILVRTSFAAVGGLLALGMGATAFAAGPPVWMIAFWISHSAY